MLPTWITWAKIAASLLGAGVVAEVLMFLLGMFDETLGNFFFYASIVLVGAGVLVGLPVALHFLWA